MAKGKDCDCKAGKDIERLESFFGSKSIGDVGLFKKIIRTIINIVGIALLFFCSLFAIPLVLVNMYRNKKRTGMPYVSLPAILNRPMKHTIKTIEENSSKLNKHYEQKDGNKQELQAEN